MASKNPDSTYMRDTSIELSTYIQFSASDTAPLQDEFDQRVLTVATKRLNVGPPAAGDLFIILLTIAVLGTTEAVRSFFSELGKDAYQALRSEMLRIYNKAKDTQTVVASVPMTVILGNVRFTFSGDFTIEEFDQCLRKADDFVGDLPESYFDKASDQPVLNAVWDVESQSWQETSESPTAARDYFENFGG